MVSEKDLRREESPSSFNVHVTGHTCASSKLSLLDVATIFLGFKTLKCSADVAFRQPTVSHLAVNKPVGRLTYHRRAIMPCSSEIVPA